MCKLSEQIIRDEYKARMEREIIRHLDIINKDNQKMMDMKVYVDGDELYFHNYNPKENNAVLILDGEFCTGEEWEHVKGSTAFIIYYWLEGITYKLYFLNGTGFEYVNKEDESYEELMGEALV